jgi:circadian clock protein KaiB
VKPSVIPKAATHAIASVAAARAGARYVLHLYVAGMTPRSTRAISNIRKICEEFLHGRYDLEVVDLARFPALAAGAQIIAAPSLIKMLPLPMRRFVGDMSQTERILLGLDIRDSAETTPPARNR